MVGKDAWYDFNFLKFTEAWFVTQDVMYPGECSVCTWEECVFWFFGCNALKIPIKSNCCIVLFRISVALLILCLEDLSIDMSGMLKSPTIVVFPSISPFTSVGICFMYFGAPILAVYMLTSVEILFLYWYFYHYIVSFFIFLYGLCFKVYFVWYEYCDPHTLSCHFHLHKISFSIPSLSIYVCPLP